MIQDEVAPLPYPWWMSFLDQGPLYLGSYLLFIMAVFVGLKLIRRKLPLPWLLLASLTPLLASMFAGHVATMCLSAYMTLPDFERTKQLLYPDIYFLWIGCLTSATLAFFSYRRHAPRPPSPTASSATMQSR